MSATPTSHPQSSSSSEVAGPPAVVVLRNGFLLAAEGDLCVVSRSSVFGPVPLYHFTRDDTVGRYLAMVDLVRHHDLYANEVADAFDVHRATLHRLLKRFV